MIEKQRLEELIEQGATICNQYIDYNNNICYRFGKASIIQDNDEQHIEFKVNGTDTSIIMYDTKYLYETEEDAEWYLEFGSIKRIETLKLPNWKEFNKKYKKKMSPTIVFRGKNPQCFYELFYKDKNIYIFDCDCAEYFYSKLLTKENYIEACRLAKKLFLGESEWNT